MNIIGHKPKVYRKKCPFCNNNEPVKKLFYELTSWQNSGLYEEKMKKKNLVWPPVGDRSVKTSGPDKVQWYCSSCKKYF